MASEKSSGALERSVEISNANIIADEPLSGKILQGISGGCEGEYQVTSPGNPSRRVVWPSEHVLTKNSLVLDALWIEKGPFCLGRPFFCYSKTSS